MTVISRSRYLVALVLVIFCHQTLVVYHHTRFTIDNSVERHIRTYALQTPGNNNTYPLTSDPSNVSPKGANVSLDVGGCFDRTLSWPPSCRAVARSTRDNSTYKLLLTNFGWNHPNKARGLAFSRTLRSRQLVQGVLNHPNFDPSAWWEASTKSQPLDRNFRYYLFLDIETCYESNYPSYAGGGLANNTDLQSGRVRFPSHRPCYKFAWCSPVKELMASPLLKNVNITLVYLDCQGEAVPLEDRRQYSSLSIASVSANQSGSRRDLDQGFVPGAVKEVFLNESEVLEIQRCTPSRKWVATFVGSFRNNLRRNIYLLRNKPNVWISTARDLPYSTETYTGMLRNSRYALVPRGDNLFTYRFTEAMSAGSIPVILSDGWVLPLDGVVNWTRCAIILPESYMLQVLRVLEDISAEEECQRRRYCFQSYRRYMANADLQVDGLVQNLEAKYT